MLRLEKMIIAGFKSFADRTEIIFRDGINAVVGPNGCGKSNIGDAINWVLGERSPKSLRGAHMADVIFSGSRNRKPIGLAEVQLHLSGTEGLLQSDHGRIVTTRRLFRNGDSEYLINGARVRLKDIQDLLNAARIGTKSYATIEQGKIEQILNAKPKDRRLMIEDAAGIGGFKQKRRLTELKLDATRANLLRVNDIVVEVKRQINSMKRQAAKARRYRRLRDELRGKDRIRFTVRLRELETKLAGVMEAERVAKDSESESAAALSRLEIEVMDARTTLDAASHEYRQSADRSHTLDIEIDRAESRIQIYKERIDESKETAEQGVVDADQLQARQHDLDKRLVTQRELADSGGRDLQRTEEVHAQHQLEFERLEGALSASREEIERLRQQQFEAMHASAEVRNQCTAVDEALERSHQRRVYLEGELASGLTESKHLAEQSSTLSTQLQAQRSLLEECRQHFSQTDEQLRSTRTQLAESIHGLVEGREQEQSALARSNTLQDVSTRFAGISEGVRVLLGAEAGERVRSVGVVADFIDAQPEVETLAESYLGWLLPTLILEDDAMVEDAAHVIHSNSAGRTSLISQTQPAGNLAVGSPPNDQGPIPVQLLNDRRVQGSLRDKIRLNVAGNGAVANRIGDAVLVDNLKSALELHREYPQVDFLASNGDVVYASGVISVNGQASSDHGILAHNRLVQEAVQEVARTNGAAARIQQQVDALQEEVFRLEAEIGERRAALEEAERLQLGMEHRSQQTAEELDRASKRNGVLDDELVSLREEIARLDTTRQETLSKAAAAQQNSQALEASLTGRIAESTEAEQHLRLSGDRLAEMRVDLAAGRQKQETIEKEALHFQHENNDLSLRLTDLDSETTIARERADELHSLKDDTERELITQLGEREELSRTNSELEQANDERRRAINCQDEKLRETRIALERMRERTRETELERTRTESDRTHLDDLCVQELGATASETASEVEVDPAEVQLDVLEAESDDLRSTLERMGAVNMTAIEEYSELEERFEFLTSQKTDLETAMAALNETIRNVNKESRERFLEAFESIRGFYKEIFTLLFNGGQADLRLEEGEDVLDCGIEILAQPPGKRLTGVKLLSGGEKAMSAIALLFAVFRYQPSPFCLLDEVDAALDDSNVDRFTHMLREYSDNTQFIMITHNKNSMAAADLLYGVTMEEQGISKVLSVELH
jgi:chromosome segregation protein